MSEYLLEMRNITKEFPGVRALENVTFQVRKEVGLKLSPASRIIDLGVGSQQLVEIAKALTKEARVLILDEPTAALTETEADNLLKILDSFRAQGVSCIYISHRLKEVAR